MDFILGSCCTAKKGKADIGVNGQQSLPPGSYIRRQNSGLLFHKYHRPSTRDSSRAIVSFNQYNFPGFVLFPLSKGRRIPRVCVTYPKQLHKLCHWPSNSSESALSGHKVPSSVAPRGAGGWAWGWRCGSLRVSQLQAWSPLHIYVFLTPNPAMQDSRSPSHGKLYTAPQSCSYPGGWKPQAGPPACSLFKLMLAFWGRFTHPRFAAVPTFVEDMPVLEGLEGAYRRPQRAKGKKEHQSRAGLPRG